MTETLLYGYSSESTQQELSNEYQHDRVKIVFVKYLHPYALDKSSLSIGRVKRKQQNSHIPYKHLYKLVQWSRMETPNPSNAEATFIKKHKDPKIFENHLNPVMLVFIR